MRHGTLGSFPSAPDRAALKGGPVAIVLLEDEVEVVSTIAHCQILGFANVIVVGPARLLPDEDNGLHMIEHDMTTRGALTTVMNHLIKALPNTWLHYCYNAEYLFYPFSDTRNVRELTTFSGDERRKTVLSFVVDLYSNDLGAHPNGVSLEAAHFDAAGYYALARKDNEGHALERQMDFFGGLRWRFGEHIPWNRRKIDRAALFKTTPDLKLREDHTFNIPEYNTYACAWHNNVSAALCSFRTAKALVTNPASGHSVQHFWWTHSTPFEWNATQLLELGLIEPGQWF